MTVRVLFFAILRERAGCKEIAVQLPEASTVGELWSTLCRTYPQFEPLSSSMSFAVDQEYVDRSSVLHADAEVALIPPVSGG